MKKQSNAPKIRFQNFEDEWLDSTIGRHISLLNGRAYKQEELLDEGKYKVLRVGNFNTNSKWYYSNLELEENKYVNKGDLLYLWATNFGPEIWTEEKAIYHYHIWKLEFDRTEINQDYLNIWLESDRKKEGFHFLTLMNNPPLALFSVTSTTFLLATRTILLTTNPSRRPCSPRCSPKLDRQFQRFVWMDLKVSGKK